MAQDRGGKPDPFKGKLFAPDIILGNQAELKLTKEQKADLIVFLKKGLASSKYPNIKPPPLPK